MHYFHSFVMSVTFISAQVHVHLYIFLFFLSLHFYSCSRTNENYDYYSLHLIFSTMQYLLDALSVSVANGKKWWQWNEIIKKAHSTRRNGTTSQSGHVSVVCEEQPVVICAIVRSKSDGTQWIHSKTSRKKQKVLQEIKLHFLCFAFALVGFSHFIYLLLLSAFTVRSFVCSLHLQHYVFSSQIEVFTTSELFHN